MELRMVVFSIGYSSSPMPLPIQSGSRKRECPIFLTAQMESIRGDERFLLNVLKFSAV
jgi:hypothetical protein